MKQSYITTQLDMETKMCVDSLNRPQELSYHIEQFEHNFASWKEMEEANVNHTAYMAYEYSKKIGQELIDFADIIWPEDVAAIVKTFRENGIKEFTISCRFCDLIDRVEEFEKLGCRMNGLTKIKSVRNMNGNVMKITALKMEIL